MKSLKKTRRIQVIVVAFVALAASFLLFYLAAPNALQYFYSPSDIAEAPPGPSEVIRVGGLVKEGSIREDVGQKFFFVITDGGADVAAHYVGDDLPPDLFNEGQGTVATGRYVDGVFKATLILAKHDETYMPAEVIDALKEQGVYQPTN